MKGFRKVTAAGARKAWLWRNRSQFGELAATEPPRLFVDVSTIIRHDARTGIQRVVRAVWTDLARRSGDGFNVQPVFATHAHGYCRAPLDFLIGGRSDRGPEPIKVRPGDRFLGLDLAAHLLPRYRRQLAAWKAHGGTVHILVYDLLPLLRPEWFSAATASNFRKWLNVVMNDADQAICISQDVAQGLHRRLAEEGLAGPEVARMQLGADIAASLPSTGISKEVSDLLNRLRFKPGILMVGTVEPRKGYDAALAAFELLWQTRRVDAPDLVIVGKPGWKTSAIQKQLQVHPDRGKRLHWLSEVSDEALCNLYEASAGVFIASRGEGFGLPLVEAAQFRRHVLARDLPVFREQGLSNVYYFKDDSPAVLADQLMDLAKGQGRPLAVPNLATWSDCVDGLLHEMGIEGADCAGAASPPRKSAAM